MDFHSSLADVVQFTGVAILVLGFSNFVSTFQFLEGVEGETGESGGSGRWAWYGGSMG